MTPPERTEFGDPNPETGEYVNYNFDDYWTFLRQLKKKYPYEWIAVRIDHEDQQTLDVRGQIIAHDIDQGVALRAASDYHEKHPECVISFFTTDMPHRRYP